MLRTSDIKHPDLAKAIEEGRPVELVGMDVEYAGGDQPAKREYKPWRPWRPMGMIATVKEYQECCGCFFQWTHDLRQRFGFECPVPDLHGVRLCKSIEDLLGLDDPSTQAEITATDGTPGQHTEADCSQQTAPAQASQPETSHPQQHAQPSVNDGPPGWWRASRTCRPELPLGLGHGTTFQRGAVSRIVICEGGPEQTGSLSVTLSTAPTQPQGPTVSEESSAGCLPASPSTASKKLTTGDSDV